jgi:ribosome-binding factor A
MAKHTSHTPKAPSQRQLRAGELIRHTLAEILQRDEVHDVRVRELNVTISEVRASPDLRNATVYCTALGGEGTDEAVAALNAAAPRIRGVLGTKIKTKHTPELAFKKDESFDEAERIARLLSDKE